MENKKLDYMIVVSTHRKRKRITKMENKKLDYMIEVAHSDSKSNLVGWDWITIKCFFAFDYDSPESILKEAKKFYRQTKKDISTNGLLRLVAIGKDVTTPIVIKQSFSPRA